jgi:hypothetical protein
MIQVSTQTIVGVLTLPIFRLSSSISNPSKVLLTNRFPKFLIGLPEKA